MYIIDLAKFQKYLEWLKTKLYLDSIAPAAAKRFIKRGQVYWCNLGMGIGSEKQKLRPCVILQNFKGNRHSANTIVAPITHSSKNLSVIVPITTQYNPDGSILLDGYVSLANIVTVSKARLGDYITELPHSDMKEIDKAIAISLDIYHYYSSIKNELNDKLNYIKNLKRQRNDMQNLLKEIQYILNVQDISEIKNEINNLLSKK